MYILPITPEGEEIREYLSTYHFVDKKCIWNSIHAYGAYEYNITYDDEIFNVILVNND